MVSELDQLMSRWATQLIVKHLQCGQPWLRESQSISFACEVPPLSVTRDERFYLRACGRQSSLHTFELGAEFIYISFAKMDHSESYCESKCAIFLLSGKKIAINR